MAAIISPTVKYTKLFINNEFVDSYSKKTFATINPSTGKKIADIAEADKEDVDIAVKAARAAFASNSKWRKLDASARGNLIFKLADLIERDIKEIAALETLDNGKTYDMSVFDIAESIKCLRYFGGLSDKYHGNTIPSDGELFTLTRKEPIGVVAQIVPWNYPMMMTIWKWSPALASGCTLVMKPSELTPLSVLYAAALSKEAGFPDGVINILPGYGHTVGEALALHNDVDKIAFTGSTKVGKLILANSSKSNLKRVTLELGGKSPVVIFNDADVNEAALIAHNALFTNHGQNCVAGSRTFVQAGIYEAFVKKSVDLAKAIKVGDPFAPGIVQGPQINQPSLDKILELIASGVKEGATLETGGKRVGTAGFFVQPTVFSNVTDNMRIATEEIFGPVQSILKFDTLEEVIERANDTPYGLAAGVVTKDLDTALAFSKAVKAGSVWVNCYDAVTVQTPFGGYKMSGFGRELGIDGLEEYMETKSISIKVPTKN